MAVAMLTGLLAFLLGWLAALEGWLRTDQPERKGNCKGPLPPLIPTAPPTLSLSSLWVERQKGATAGEKLGRLALLEVVERDWLLGGARGRVPLTSQGISLTSLRISMTSVTHWPRLFNISWPLEPAPYPSPQAPFVCLPLNC